MFRLKNIFLLIKTFIAIFVVIWSCGVAHSRVADPKIANPEAYNIYLKNWKKQQKMDEIKITESPFYEKLDSIIGLCKKKYPNFRWKKRTHFTWYAEYIESHKDVDTLDYEHINMLEAVSEPIVVAVTANYSPSRNHVVIYKDKKYYFYNTDNWKYYKKRYKSTRRRISYLNIFAMPNLVIIVLYKPNGTMSIKDVYFGIDDLGVIKFAPEELE